MTTKNLSLDEQVAVNAALGVVIRSRAFHPALSRDDLLQEGALRLFSARGRLDANRSEAALFVWRRRLASGAMLDAVRRENGRDGGSRSAPAPKLLPLPAFVDCDAEATLGLVDEAQPEHELNCKQHRQALAMLPHRLAQVAALVQRGDPFEAIAESLNVCPSRITQLRREIRQRVELMLMGQRPTTTKPCAASRRASRPALRTAKI